MKVITAILFILTFTSCGPNFHLESDVNKEDSIKIDSIYSPGTWHSFFQTIKTPLGNRIKFKIINNNNYFIQWGDSLNLRTCEDTLYLDGHEGRIPKFIVENKEYIVMRLYCGNPCWAGYFLPLNDTIKPHIIYEYLNFDLANHLVASVSDNKIEITNLKTNQREYFILKGCASAALHYCIDSVTFSNKLLRFIWIPETKFDSKKGKVKIFKIKI